MRISSFLHAYTHSLGGPWFIISTAGLSWSLPRIWLGRNPRGVESLARNSHSPMWWLHPTVLNLGVQQRALLLCASYSSPLLLLLHHTQGHLTKGFVTCFVLNWEGQILNWQSYCHEKKKKKVQEQGTDCMQQRACLTKGHNSTSINSWAVHAKWWVSHSGHSSFVLSAIHS